MAVCACILLPSPLAAAQASTGYRAAILVDPTLPAAGPVTPLAEWMKGLAEAGIQVTPLDAAQLADAQTFNIERFRLLIVPTGPVFPAEARQALLAFLKAGGDLWTCGGYAFDKIVVRSRGGWSLQDDLMKEAVKAARDVQRSLVPNGDFARGLDGWQIAPSDACRIVEDGPRPGTRAGEARQSTSAGGARWACRLDVRPGQRYLVGAQARAYSVSGPGFGFLAVYQYDASGKIVKWQDFAHLTGTSRNWMRFEAPIDIAADASRVEFQAGLYQAEGRLQFGDVTCARLPQEIRINAHYGTPEDGLRIDPDQLTVFSPDQPVQGVALVAAPQGGILGRWKSPGRVEGYEATAQLRQSARWRPLVNVVDEYGRCAGTAGSMVYWSAGPFKGGTWVLFGVTNRDVFNGPAGEELLRDIGSMLVQGVHVEAAAVDEAIYRPGETAGIVIRCANRSQNARSVRLTVRLVGRGGEGGMPQLARFQRELSLAPGEEVQEQFPWKVPADAPDFIEAAASLEALPAEGAAPRPLDAANTGFCVYSPSVLASGPRVSFRNNAFDIASSGAPHVLFGTDTYANMFLSPSEDPLAWFRGLSLMKDYELSVFENLQYTPQDYRFTQKQQRQLDALVQLAQRFRLVYMAGLLIGHDVAVDEDELDRQARFCADFARRYRNVPGIIYYLNGDFQLHLKDTPGLRKLWNEFLRRRYSSDAALHASWGDAASSASLGSIPVAGYTARGWGDARARDVADFEAHLVRRWIRAMTGAIRRVDPVHPITAEYYQRPFGGIDLRLTMDGMDAANIGYFGPPGQDTAMLSAVIKWNDMSFFGKGINIGEFGVKTHDAWLPERGASGYHIRRTPRQQQELFWWIAHAAIAFGVSKIQNWCWADDPDGVFPWGVVWNNPLRPKPVLKLYRNLSLLARTAGWATQSPRVVLVMPDAFREGAPQERSWIAVMNSIQCLLGTGIPFQAVNQRDLAHLAAHPPKCLFFPLAASLDAADVGYLSAMVRQGTKVYLSAPPGGGRWPPDGLNGHTLRLAWPWPVSRMRLGKGVVFLCSVPWELLEGRDLFGADDGRVLEARGNLYLQVARAMGLHPRNPGPCLGVAREEGSGLVLAVFPLRNAGNSRNAVSLSRGRARCEWRPAPRWPCIAIADDRGRIRAATGDGALFAGGRRMAWSDGPWMLAALDGAPIASSRLVAAMMPDGGILRFRSTVAGMGAAIVEWRNGAMHRVAPLRMEREGGVYRVAVPKDELVLVTSGGMPPEALKLMDAGYPPNRTLRYRRAAMRQAAGQRSKKAARMAAPGTHATTRRGLRAHFTIARATLEAGAAGMEGPLGASSMRRTMAAVNSVSVTPGRMRLTSMPLPSSSIPRASVRAFTAHFAAA